MNPSDQPQSKAIDPAWFRRVLGQYPTGVSVVTAVGTDGRPVGMAVGSFTSVSLDPPLVAFFPDKSSSTWPKMKPAGSFCVNILSEDQEWICRLFATKGVDRFADLSWRAGGSGAPVIDQAVAWIDCDLASVEEAGDHFIVTGRVRELDVANDSLPLLFYRGGYGKFAPLSLASGGADVLGALRKVDLARPKMEAIAEKFGVQCVATAVTDGHLAVLASAGEPAFGPAVPISHRVPFVPPLGSVFRAWSSEPRIESWLRTLPAMTPERRGHLLRSLERVRQRQFSVAGGMNRHWELLEVNEELLRGPSDPTPLLARRQALVATLIDDYEPACLDHDVNDVRSVNVPVFADGDEVAFMLSVFGLPDRVSGRQVAAYADRLTAAAKALSAALSGRWPAVVPYAGSPSHH